MDDAPAMVGRFPIQGRSLIAGAASGEIVFSDTPLSFWGGVDPFTGIVIDRHHPLFGTAIGGKVLAIPGSRGSCTGSSVMLELILQGHAPAALVMSEPEEILTLGVLIAETLFARSLPVLSLAPADYSLLASASEAHIDGARLSLSGVSTDHGSAQATVSGATADVELTLDDRDQAMLAGHSGPAAALAMDIVTRVARMQGASSLIDVSQAHIDGCIYTGPASLRFAEHLVGLGAKVRVPTTLNSISVDRRRWRALGVAADLGEPSDKLAQAYVDMGARPTFTCAPYLLESRPALNDQIVWAESNAVVYANSVLGARTQKYPDYLDICIALTGRAPNVGCHLDAGRRATLRVDVKVPEGIDDSFYPLLGYLVGLQCGSEIPVLCGLEDQQPSADDLKAFGAAFATTSAAPMFHIVGATPEAATLALALGDTDPARTVQISRSDLETAWRELDSATEEAVQLVSLGNPHLSLAECATLATLCHGRLCDADTSMVLTMGRAVEEQAREAGHLAAIEAFGATIVTDTCWCMLGEPVIPPASRTLITNSGKYAHYAPGLVGRAVQFASMAACIEAAVSGKRTPGPPAWLRTAA